MSQGARWKRRVGIAAGVLLSFALLLAWLVPSLLHRTVENRVHDALRSQGLEASWSALRWQWSGAVVVEDLELRSHPGAQRIASIDRLEADLDLAALRQGDPRFQRLHLGSVEIDTDGVRGHRQASQPALRPTSDGAPDADTTTPRQRRRPDPAAVLPTGLAIDRLHVSPLPPPFAETLEAVTLESIALTPSDEETWRLRATLRHNEHVALPAPLQPWHLARTDGLVLELLADNTGSLQAIEVRSSDSVVLENPSMGARVAVDALRVENRQALSVEGLAFSLEERFRVRVDAVALQLTAPYAGLSTMRMERLTLEDVHTWVGLPPRKEEDNDEPEQAAAQEDREQAAAPSPSDIDAEAGAPAHASPSWMPAGWESRPFWEQLPQFIEVDQASLEIENPRDEGPPLALVVERFRYGLRVLQSRMEFALTARVQTSEEETSRVQLEGHWHYGRNEPTLRLEIENLQLEPLRAWLPALPPLEGKINLSLGLRDERGEIDRSLTGNLSLEAPALDRDGARFALAEERLAYAWAHDITRDGRRQNWLAREGRLTLDAFEVDVDIDLDGVRLDRWPPLEGGRVRIGIGEGPAQETWASLPPWLTEGLGNPRFSGNFGLDLQWGFQVHTLDDGRPTLRFRNPWGATLADATLRIESIHRDVDPRRLVDEFSFLFRGPQDRIMRRMHVPPGISILTDPTPPITLRQIDPHALFQDPEQPWNHDNWARLDDISWYLIAMQLFREDGSFFRNDGVNWFQLRRVIEEAIDRRRLGRGASTITMQLVKNTLLTHERSLQRKLHEILLSYWVTRLVPKERILEIYLNVIEWGPDINGIVEASQYYFNKHPRDLNLGEATWLSAITPSPARYSRQRERGEVSPGFWRFCQDLMRGLHRNGWITEAELQRGLVQRPRFVTEACIENCPPEIPSGASETDSEPSPLSAELPVESDHPRTPVPGLLHVPPQQRIHLLVRSAREPASWQRRP